MTGPSSFASRLGNLDPKLRQELDQWEGRLVDDISGGAFAVEERVEAVRSLLATGRNVVLVGPRGVGKTAVAREVGRRLGQGAEPRAMVELSVRRRQSKLSQPHQLVKAVEGLVDALLALGAIPFFEDGDVLRSVGAGALISVVSRLEAPVLVEGTPDSIGSWFEDDEELDEHFVRLPLNEPDVETTQAILRALVDGGDARFEKPVDDAAIEEAVYLGQRFLARSCFPRKAIDLLAQTSAVSPGRVDRDRVLSRFCETHETPPWLVDPRAPFDLGEIEDRLRTAVLGQDEAVGAAIRLIATMKTGLSDLRRPFGTFLFTGPTGVGKTHLAQTLAELLFGGRDRMVRINMGDYADDAEGRLFGNPHAYPPNLRRGDLTQALLGRPFAVLLLDELEKANPVLFDRFLPLMDEGMFVNGAGESISCRSMIIVATTNAGAEVFRGAGIGFAGDQNLAEKKRLVELRVRDVFRFEFLNRFDAIVHFNPLTREATRTIARWELDRLRDRVGLRRYGLHLSIDEAVLDWLAVHGYHPDFGARFLKRTIERSVTRALAETIARRSPPPGSAIEVVVRGRKIHCRIEKKGTGTRPEPAVIAPTTGAPRAVPASEVETRAGALLAGLEARERERAELLERMNVAGFGAESDTEGWLDRFREVDVWVAMARRLAAPIEEWLAAGEAGGEADPGLLERALAAVLRWEEKQRLAGPSALWVVVSAVDAHQPATAWVESLTRIELHYCRRCELEARVEAVELGPSGPIRVVLEVEGAGAAHHLAAEAGLHRLRVAHGPDAVARVDLVPRTQEESDRPVRPRSVHEPRFGLSLTHETRIEVPELGWSCRLLGRSGPSLAQIAGDVGAALTPGRPEPVPARIHGGGGAVTDPRTGVTVPSRQVEKGRLEPFLDGFLAAETPSAPVTWS